MSEKITFNPEHKESSKEIQKAGLERQEELREQLEREQNREQGHEIEEQKARHEALKEAAERQEVVAEKARESSPAERRGPINKDASFNATMSEVRSQMSAPSRAFSKVIHNKAVEKASEMTASTVARPNALLSGAVFAFVLTLGVYLLAKNLGYPLSGFETIGAFVLGWILGIVYDFLKTMITGKK